MAAAMLPSFKEEMGHRSRKMILASIALIWFGLAAIETLALCRATCGTMPEPDGR